MARARPLIFDAADHSYRIGGRRLAGVTDVIKHVGAMKGSDFYTEEGRERGRIVDACCQIIFSGRKIDPDSLDERIAPYVVSLEAWIEISGFKAKTVQGQGYDEALGYAGTWDVTGSLYAFESIVIDTKAGGEEKWHRMQTAAYQRLAHIPYRGGLYPQKDGSPAKFREHKDPTDWIAFRSALEIYNSDMKLEAHRKFLAQWMEAA